MERLTVVGKTKNAWAIQCRSCPRFQHYNITKLAGSRGFEKSRFCVFAVPETRNCWLRPGETFLFLFLKKTLFFENPTLQNRFLGEVSKNDLFWFCLKKNVFFAIR